MNKDATWFVNLVLLGIVGLFIFSFCGRREDASVVSDKQNITYIDFNYILPHDTIAFKTAEEEYKFLVEANNFKRRVGDKLLDAQDIIEKIMYNTFDCDDSITIDTIDEILEERGYYKLINEVDSLLKTQL